MITTRFNLYKFTTNFFSGCSSRSRIPMENREKKVEMSKIPQVKSWSRTKKSRENNLFNIQYYQKFKSDINFFVRELRLANNFLSLNGINFESPLSSFIHSSNFFFKTQYFDFEKSCTFL